MVFQAHHDETFPSRYLTCFARRTPHPSVSSPPNTRTSRAGGCSQALYKAERSRCTLLRMLQASGEMPQTTPSRLLPPFALAALCSALLVPWYCVAFVMPCAVAFNNAAFSNFSLVELRTMLVLVAPRAGREVLPQWCCIDREGDLPKLCNTLISSDVSWPLTILTPRGLQQCEDFWRVPATELCQWDRGGILGKQREVFLGIFVFGLVHLVGKARSFLH